MRNNPDFSLTMAMLVTDSDRPSPKVWQPWYIDETDGVRKELPTRALREQRIKERMAMHKPTNRRTHSPSHSSDEEIDVGVPPSSHTGSYSYAYLVESFDEDTPLDMSIKRRSPPPAHTPTPPLHPPPHVLGHPHTPPPSYILPALQPPPPPAHTTSSSASPPPYLSRVVYPPPTARGRPTVITCASPNYLPPFSPSHEPSTGVERPYAHVGTALPPSYPDRYAPPPPYSVAAAQLREKLIVVSNAEASTSPKPEVVRKLSEGSAEEAKRQVVQGPVDPEIDEHFRRSLGRNYQELFIAENSSDHQPESSDSVDDHFAKALGETWTKLKAKGRGDRGGISTITQALTSAAPYIRGVSSSSVSPLRNLTPPSLAPIALSRIPSLQSIVSTTGSRGSPSSDTLIIQGSNEVSITRIPSSYSSPSGSVSYPETPLSLTSKIAPT